MLNSRMTKNLVFGCAAVLLITGSGVNALADGQGLNVLAAGNNRKENKDNNSVQRKKLGKKDDPSTGSKRDKTKRDPIIPKQDEYIERAPYQ